MEETLLGAGQEGVEPRRANAGGLELLVLWAPGGLQSFRDVAAAERFLNGGHHVVNGGLGLHGD